MPNKRKPVLLVQGAQWGSEAKGAIAAYLCQSREVDFAVRTGAVNAGHTVVYKGNRYAMQQLPTGWINPSTQLVIGAGAYIHPPTLAREINWINEAMPGSDVRDRLWVDIGAGVHTDVHSGLSATANRHHSIGATGKGCSEAIVDKIRNRNNGYRLFRDTVDANLIQSDRWAYTAQMLNTQVDKGATILIEGTQGTLLDLHLGPYPFTTSRMTTAANWVAECGLSPALDYEVVLVARTYPIRVAGNSGPMDGEIEWVDLARSINDKLIRAGRSPKVGMVSLAEFESQMERVAAEATLTGKYRVPMIDRRYRVRLSEWTAAERSEYRVAASELHRDAINACRQSTRDELRGLFEMTTVTRKLRRIANLSIPDLEYAIQINRPSWIALTFLDYIEPELVARPNRGAVRDAIGYVRGLSKMLGGVPIPLISIGPSPDHVHKVEGLDGLDGLEGV